MFKRKAGVASAEGQPRVLTPGKAKKARELCRQRDGDKCAVCGKDGKVYRHEKKRDFDLDHIDGNKKNNPSDGSNWQLACHSCNCKKDPRGVRAQPYFNGVNRLKKARERTKERERSEQWEQENDRLIPPSMRANLEREPIFRRTALMLMKSRTRMKRKDLLDACCESSGASQQAGSNYLDKMCSELGTFLCETKLEEGKRYVLWRRRNGHEND